MTFSIQNELSKYSAEQKEGCEKNQEILQKYLEENFNIELRDDSRLAFQFIVGKEQDIQFIAKEIWINTLLYKYSDYETQLKEKIPKEKYSVMQGNEWFPEIKRQVSDYITNFFIPLIKIGILKDIMKNINH